MIRENVSVGGVQSTILSFCILLFGFSIGVTYVGGQIPLDCTTVGGQLVGEACLFVRHAEKVAFNSAGAAMMCAVGAMVLEWYDDEDGR